MKLALTLLIIVVALIGVSLFPVGKTETAPFASPAFQRAWSTDTSAATRPVDLWGSEPLVWRVESYQGALNNRRTVQYFDRGRMELQAGSSEVTLGLLAREMTTGMMSLGEHVDLEQEPPEIPIDSGELDDRVPTYLTLGRLVGERAEDRSTGGQRVTDWIDRSGVHQRGSMPDVIRLAEYVDETGHNLPSVTVDLFNLSEFSDGKWLEKFGYPISEPYWTYYRRSESMVPSLIQVFERRILVYSPTLESDKRFTVANTGRHYYMWRYGTSPQEQPDERVVDELVPADLTLADDIESYVYARDFGTPIDLALSSTGHLLILTAEGQILRADGPDPDGLAPDGFSVWADNVAEPLGMVARGDSVLVTTNSGTRWYREVDGHGLLDDSQAFADAAMLAPGIVGRPVVDSSGRVYHVAEGEPDGEPLLEYGADEPLLDLEQMIAEPGPLRFSGNNLFVAGSDEDRRAKVLMLPAGDSAGNEEPSTLVTFPKDSVARALAICDETIWPLSEIGTLFVAVQDPDAARVYALSLNRPDQSRDPLEIASGFSRPTAMIFGLDGSLYVADADAQTITRIMPRD